MPGRSPTRRPAPSSRRYTRRPPTCRTRSASTRDSSTRARRTPRARRSKRTSRRSRAARRAFAFASGMAAIAAVASFLEAGDHVDRHGQHVWRHVPALRRVLRRYQLHFTYVDTGDLDATAKAFTPATRMLFVETPTNPVLGLTDLAAAASLAHGRGAKLVVDNTFASPRCSGRSSSAPTWCCTARRSTSTATATASAASSWRWPTRTSSG